MGEEVDARVHRGRAERGVVAAATCPVAASVPLRATARQEMSSVWPSKNSCWLVGISYTTPNAAVAKQTFCPTESRGCTVLPEKRFALSPYTWSLRGGH